MKLFQMMKEGSVKLNDIYGWNLHSVPGRPKKYPPKPNLYSFFVALGFALLKDNGRFCYIIPQTMLTEPDYDVVRYQLSHFYTIDSLITFSGKLFVGRSTDQRKEVATSSLILVCTKKRPAAGHQVECVSVLDRDLDVRELLARLQKQRAKIRRMISQKDLRANVSNWNFVTWGVELARLYRSYQRQSESMARYFEHELAQGRFRASFYFDVGFILDRSKERNERKGGKWGLVRFQDFVNFTNFRPTTFYPSAEEDIGLPKNSQGYGSLYQRHKLLWEKSRRFKFYYTDADVVPSMSHCQIISSDSRKEIFSLFAVLNSSVTRYIFESMFSLGNEKVGMFVAISRLKQFVRPPLVDSIEKQGVKEKIIAGVRRALEMEGLLVGEMVDIDTLVRRVDKVRVEGEKLVARHRGGELSFVIEPECVQLVEAALAARDEVGDELFDGERSISIRELKSLPAFDRAAQRKILNDVGEWVLDLYGISERGRRTLRRRRVE